jgi:hypothetical protein
MDGCLTSEVGESHVHYQTPAFISSLAVDINSDNNSVIAGAALRIASGSN